ncbi:MAG: ABC transporter substrate-binding protein [Synergistaceae bacterium]|nr:ABC transporter substrate-binding protein [Synergistaceae bacterium]
MNKKITVLIAVVVIAAALWVMNNQRNSATTTETAPVPETSAETPADTTTTESGEGSGGIAANVAAGYENILRLATWDEPNQNDPQKTTEYYSINFQIFDRLVEAVTAGPARSELVPGLAESWEVTDDGLTYTFNLRKGVKFHNGAEFTAKDVKYTFERMLWPETEAKNQDFIDPIKGSTEVMEGTAKELSGVEIVDDYTIKVTLKEPFAPFIASLATPSVSILNMEATEAAGADFGLVPEKTIGTGAYIFDKWVLRDELLVRRNDNYWRGAPELDGISWKVVQDADTMRLMFESGEIDVFDTAVAVSQIEYFANNPKYAGNLAIGDIADTNYYSFNQRIKPFDDVRVRKALQMAVDRQGMLDALFGGRGTLSYGIIARGIIGHNPDLPAIPYDPEAAKALLAEAGYPDGFEMTVTQIANQADTLAKNELFQSMMSEIGVKVTIDQMDSAAWYAVRADGDLPSYATYWAADYNDPDNFIYTFFAPGNTVRRSFNFNNEELSKRVVAARAITVPQERIKEYQALEKAIIQDEAAWIPLFQRQHIFVVNNRVEGFKVSWNGWSDGWYYYEGLRIKP